MNNGLFINAENRIKGNVEQVRFIQRSGYLSI
jgi:hypothetical protein